MAPTLEEESSDGKSTAFGGLLRHMKGRRSSVEGVLRSAILILIPAALVLVLTTRCLHAC